MEFTEEDFKKGVKIYRYDSPPGGDEAFNQGMGYKMLRLSIDKISDVETVTVIRKKFPNAPWIVVTKEFFESGNIDDLYENTVINYGGGDINTGGANQQYGFENQHYSAYDPIQQPPQRIGIMIIKLDFLKPLKGLSIQPLALVVYTVI